MILNYILVILANVCVLFVSVCICLCPIRSYQFSPIQLLFYLFFFPGFILFFVLFCRFSNKDVFQ